MRRLLVIACGALAHDLARLRDANQWSFLDIQCLPAELHNYPEKITPAVKAKIHANRANYKDRIFIAYADCGTGGQLDQMIREEGVERLPGAHCYEFFLGQELFRSTQQKSSGSFFLTDFLAIYFERLIVCGLQLDKYPQLKSTYFSHYTQIIYLCQNQKNPKAAQCAQEASEFLGLPLSTVFTGEAGLKTPLQQFVQPLQ